VPEDGWVDEDVAQQIKSRMRAEFGDGNQGGIAVLSAGAKVTQFGFDPQSMSLLSIHKHCEERIAAVMNVPAMVAQLGAGLEQASQFSNFHEAREMMTENTLVPLWQSDGETLTGQLLGDFSARADEVLMYDLDRVRALEQDITTKYGRLQIAVKGGWMTANEARAMVGMSPINAKDQQVPLTQGEDNRFNSLVEKGLVTLNEVRESVGLPPRPEGDTMLRDLAPGTTETQAAESAASNATAAGTPEARPNTDNSRGQDEPVPNGENRSGANVQPPPPPGTPRQKALDLIAGALAPDELFNKWREAKGAGKTLSQTLVDE